VEVLDAEPSHIADPTSGPISERKERFPADVLLAFNQAAQHIALVRA
jgi:hypothetical protein